MIYTITGPSGSGKTTLLWQLTSKYPDRFLRIVTATTRPPRPKEKDGYDYDFIRPPESFEDFQEAYLSAIFFDGNFYGIPPYAVPDLSRKGKDAIVVLDPQGAKMLREHFPNTRNVFIKIRKKKARSHLWHRNAVNCTARFHADVDAGFYDENRIPYDLILQNQGSIQDMVDTFLAYAQKEVATVADISAI